MPGRPASVGKQYDDDRDADSPRAVEAELRPPALHIGHDERDVHGRVDELAEP